MITYLGSEILDVDSTNFVSIDRNNLEASHSCTCRVGTMSTLWDNANLVGETIKYKW